MSYDYTATNPSTDLGSDFTAGLSGSLSRIDIPLAYYNQTGPKLDAQVRVWNVDASGLPTGAALATQVIPEATLATASAILSATFLAPATVTAGSKYALSLGFLPAPGTPTSYLGINIVTGAPDKQMVAYQTSWNPVAAGMGFTTYVDAPAAAPAAPAPPAPGLAKTGFDAQPYLLLAGGLLGLGVIAFGISSARRRRKA